MADAYVIEKYLLVGQCRLTVVDEGIEFVAQFQATHVHIRGSDLRQVVIAYECFAVDKLTASQHDAYTRFETFLVVGAIGVA